MRIAITLICSCSFVVLLFFGLRTIGQRNGQLSAKGQAEAQKIVIPAVPNFARVRIVASAPGAWYSVNTEIHVCGTVPTSNDMHAVRSIVESADLAFPVSWELRLDGDESLVAIERPEMQRKMRMEQLIDNIAFRLVSYWGLSPLLFPAVLLALFSVARTPLANRVLDGALLAWGLWLLSFDCVATGFWLWTYVLDRVLLVLAVALAWAFVTSVNYPANIAIRLRLLIPLTLPVIAEAFYSPLNAGYLVHRFGCGCAFGGMNANHITDAVAVLVWLCSMYIACRTSRGHAQKFRVVHFVLCGAVTLWLCRRMVNDNMWL